MDNHFFYKNDHKAYASVRLRRILIKKVITAVSGIPFSAEKSQSWK